MEANNTIAKLVSAACSEGTSLEDVVGALRKEWSAQRRAARTPAQKAATKAKTAATRAKRAAETAAGEARLQAYLTQVAANEAALKRTVPKDLWTKFEAAVLNEQLSGSKDWSKKGVLRKTLGRRWNTILAAAGLVEDFDF